MYVRSSERDVAAQPQVCSCFTSQEVALTLLDSSWGRRCVRRWRGGRLPASSPAPELIARVLGVQPWEGGSLGGWRGERRPPARGEVACGARGRVVASPLRSPPLDFHEGASILQAARFWSLQLLVLALSLCQRGKKNPKINNYTAADF